MTSILQKYLEKNFYKTGSLFANGLVGIGEILNANPTVKREAFDLGVWMGSLFQVVDDILDFRNDGQLDKESLKDVRDSIYNLSVFSVVAKKMDDSKSASSFLALYTKKDKSEDEIRYLFEELSQENVRRHCEAMVAMLATECEKSLQRICNNLHDKNDDDSRSIFLSEMRKIVEMFHRRQK